LILTLPTEKVSRIPKVVKMWNAIVTMFLGWLCNIYVLTISFANGLDSKKTLRVDTKVTSLRNRTKWWGSWFKYKCPIYQTLTFLYDIPCCTLPIYGL
jgi:hypothetical protein